MREIVAPTAEIRPRDSGVKLTRSKRIRTCLLLLTVNLSCFVWADPTGTAKPNFDGVWDFRTATPLEAPESVGSDGGFSAAQAREFEKESEESWRKRVWDEPWADRGRELSEGNRASLIIDPTDGRLPPRTEYGKTLVGKWRESMDAVHTNDPEDRTVLERCIVSSSVPLQSSTFNNNIRIVQTPDHVVIVVEMVHEARIAKFDAVRNPGIRSWNGHSTAAWEDDTLVLMTAGFRQFTNRIGTSPDMKIQERFSLIGADKLAYEYTVEDPLVFTSPWTAKQTLTRSDGLIYEYGCHEGNHSLTAILRGSRLEDQPRSGVSAND
jgi:hypothetical protein